MLRKLGCWESESKRHKLYQIYVEYENSLCQGYWKTLPPSGNRCHCPASQGMWKLMASPLQLVHMWWSWFDSPGTMTVAILPNLTHQSQHKPSRSRRVKVGREKIHPAHPPMPCLLSHPKHLWVSQGADRDKRRPSHCWLEPMSVRGF